MSYNREFKPVWVSVQDTTKLIPFGVTSIYAMIADGRLQSCLVGRRRMISYASIERLGVTGKDRPAAIIQTPREKHAGRSLT